MISLDKIAKINVFKVPIDYFEKLPLTIQQRIDLQEEPHISFAKKSSFATPVDYFEGLSSKILSRINKIERTKVEIESLERVNVFQTPHGYFENLDERINANVWIESIDKKNVFNVPDNYFQNLELSSGIERFNKVNVFNVPKGYFEALADEIESKIVYKKETRVIHVNWFSKNVKWSAAASIILMIGLWFAVPQLTKDKTSLALEKVSNEDIKTYLETQDLSYLEYESVVENEKIPSKTTDSKALEGLKIDKQEILEHLQNQDLEEDI